MLQIIAMISMLIDHIGLLYNITVFRIIGRLSMPIYGYFLYRSTLKDSDNKKHLKRLLLFGIVSQFPFMVMIHEKTEYRFNICITWAVCYAFMLCYNKWFCEPKIKWLILTMSTLAILLVIPCDYGIIALVWLHIWMYKENIYIVLALLLPLLCLSVSQADYIQLFSVLTIPLVYACEKHNKLYMPKEYKSIWRYFYPLHLGVLSCLR